MLAMVFGVVEISDKTHLGQVETRTVTTVIVVPVHVEDLLAVYGEKARKDTFGKSSPLYGYISCTASESFAS